MDKQSNIDIMKHCIELAKNNLTSKQYALAALIIAVKGNIVFETSSKLVTGYDSTAHPEVFARRFGTERKRSNS